ncbi:MAG: YihY/virulence factor BrkB family protein [Flavobacteriaceae bacterium]|nr:YihY/virulence factor BrkB family protein [Flavobacteriaceae bacterium]
MSKIQQIQKITIHWVAITVSPLKKIIIPGFGGITIYQLLQLYLIGILKGTISMRASSVSFSFFLALFPFLLFLFNLIPFASHFAFLSPDNFEKSLLRDFGLVIPSDSQSFFNQIFNEIQNRPRAGLLSSVFLLSVFFSANGIRSLFASFQESYHLEITRNFFSQFLYAASISIIIALLILIGVGSFFYMEGQVLEIAQWLGFNDYKYVRYIQLGFFGFIILLIVCILYKFGSIETRKVHFFSAGSFFTTVLFFVSTYLFGIYVDNFSSYNQLYGSLGALLIFLIYIFLNANILLLGFELNVTIRKLKKMKQSTES